MLASWTGLVDYDFAVHLFGYYIIRRIRRLSVSPFAHARVVRDLPVSECASASARTPVFVVSRGSAASSARLRGRLEGVGALGTDCAFSDRTRSWFCSISSSGARHQGFLACSPRTVVPRRALVSTFRVLVNRVLGVGASGTDKAGNARLAISDGEVLSRRTAVSVRSAVSGFNRPFWTDLTKIRLTSNRLLSALWTVEAFWTFFSEDLVLRPEPIVSSGVDVLVVSREKRRVVRLAPVALLTKSRLGAARGTIDASFSCLVTNVLESIRSSSKTEEMLGTFVALIHESRELASFREGASWALPRSLSSLRTIVTRRAMVKCAISVHVTDGFFETIPSSFTGLAIVSVFSQLIRPVSCSWAYSWL